MYEELEKKIKYSFRNKELLRTAMTHSSYANENKDKGIESNERLEFLGDSVLSLIVSSYMFRNFKRYPEGELTKMRASTVCERSLYGCALKIELGKYLSLGKGEEQTNGRERTSILADAFEALLGAVYLDGGFETAKDVIMPLLKETVDAAKKGKAFKDSKTILQEIVQKNKQEVLEYVLVKESGPDHDKFFEVEVHLNSNVIGTGQGRSKKDAEQTAAEIALRLMGAQ